VEELFASVDQVHPPLLRLALRVAKIYQVATPQPPAIIKAPARRASAHPGQRLPDPPNSLHTRRSKGPKRRHPLALCSVAQNECQCLRCLKHNNNEGVSGLEYAQDCVPGLYLGTKSAAAHQAASLNRLSPESRARVGALVKRSASCS
jgi:hypothetical protein